MAKWIPELGMKLTYDEVRLPVSVWPDGRVSADGTRLALETVLYAIREANSPESIVEMFPGTDLGHLYLLEGYYWSRWKEAREYLRKQNEAAEWIRAEIEAQPGYKEHIERFQERARGVES